MPTSGTCRRTEPGRRRASGFTLLEIIVVLAIMGLVAAVATPSVLRGIDSWRRQAQVDAVMDQVRGLPGSARAAGRPIEISNESLAAPDAPLRVEEDWTLLAPRPWWIQANGVCPDAVLELHGAGGTRVIQVEAPFCEPRVGDAG